ncbi:hypothetical protein LJC08_01370 [Methanimicrococcus sp. OttesenSCG-928-J09]|nr:hypothetical protein [Methanimicrococcus sp. OttesenSCG-928-J09]
MTIIELDQNGVKSNKEVDISNLKTVADILKSLKINEETALVFYKEMPVPFDEPITAFENIENGGFRILKVIFDE